jgi:16S rRNA (guanine966-N2)-methyltransferase
MGLKARIIAGTHRSRLFELGAFPHTRPTKDRVKEALFNQLTPLSQYHSVCDCFAGVGSLSFEAASRGASNITCIEKERDTFALLHQNKTLLNLNLTLVQEDSLAFLKNTTASFDLILLDPPYESSLIIEALDLIHHNQRLNKGGVIACLHDTPFKHKNFRMLKQKKYGKTYVSLWKEPV